MNQDEFVNKVQAYTGLQDPDEANKVIRATMETINDRLPRTHREHLAAQLPEELKQYFPRRPHMEYLLLEEFYRRVADRADLSYQNAVKYSAAVVRVLQEAVAPGELEDILAGFPDEFHELFGRAPRSPLSPSAVRE